MDKILSARIDETILHKIAFLAQRQHVSKKKIIESAVEMYTQKMERAGEVSVFDQTSGAWRRHESIDQTVAHARNSFRKSMRRYQS
jgi:hypothetical protein